LNSATGSNRSRLSLQVAAPSKSRPMENCSIPNSSPAIGPISMPWSRQSKNPDHGLHHSNTPTLHYSSRFFVRRVTGAWWSSSTVESWTLRLFNAQRSTLNTQRSIQTVGCWMLDIGRSPRQSPSTAEAGWTFPSSRRVTGAWWPSRSSKPLSVRKSRGRFDSCPLRQSSTIEAAVSAASSTRHVRQSDGLVPWRACLYGSVERR
jgi:hypothetical protein